MPSKRVLLLALAIASVGCGSDSSGPSDDPPAGFYTATSFVTTGASGETDQIAAGSTLQLNLLADGGTSGHLHIADAGNGQPFDADMVGTWTANGSVVTVSQSADTFVRNMPFTSAFDPTNGWVLTGDKAFSGMRVQITLRRAAVDPV
jgi:hypothetical protein